MRYYDVFNGDADGICALHQLRLADPLDAVLVTGIKRDIELLRDLPAARGDVVTVLDVSLDRNRAGLAALLERGVHVRYFDHHYAGPIPSHPDLEAVIDERAGMCTSALVDRHLAGRFRPWAVVGAFGDNLDATAARLARDLALTPERLAVLRELGATLNYNAYGSAPGDVLVAPVELYRLVRQYADPFELAAREPVLARITAERHADLERALAQRPAREAEGASAYVLPDAAWSRRVIGTFANRLARARPAHAHAVLAPEPGGGYAVSVRAPDGRGVSAAEFCRRYPGGGGRALAGGIDRLGEERLARFLDEFAAAWRG